MHGRLEGEERKRRLHMWSATALGTTSETAGAIQSSVVLPPQSLSSLVPAATSENLSEPESVLSPIYSSFVKDGRIVRVGDSALFQAGNAPPSIGIIRCFTKSLDVGAKLCVNWLYRPADVKLTKGILLDAAPNEVFYLFHQDVISAASLLHPCKVAFLRRSGELPSGISSFVCRRVYDIANKCLWWLTDQDYINERQEEVDNLLNRTQLEMHAAIPSGGRSPKPLNGPTNTQQVKYGSESVQNSGTSSASQTKGRKRDRGDQGSEPVKRERSDKPEDGNSSGLKYESTIRGEIVKITERGCLTSSEGAEKLVNLMQLDRMDRKIDLSGRILIAEAIATSDRCNHALSRILQLSGLPILDAWLQEAHKGGTNEGISPKENDKIVEEFLLSLLRALDKLPVDLHALKSCNIGKSVNHLRSHKNVEIHRKAKSLVDTWKKRVDAEMTRINDAKSAEANQQASSLAKAGSPDGFQAGNRRVRKTDGSGKGPVIQPSSCKILAGKPVGSNDQLSKLAVTGGSFELLSAVKEDKSSGSSQSLNNSLSCSSEHGKVVGSWKEDARSSNTGSLNSVKGHTSSSQQRRSSNKLSGEIPGVQKESNQSKASSLTPPSALDNASQSGLHCERPLDVPVADVGNNHKFIVKFPNPGRIPTPKVSGGPLEDSSVTESSEPSPGTVERHELNYLRMKISSDACRSHSAGDANTDSWRSSDVKDGFLGAGGCKLSSTTLDEEYNPIVEDSGKPRDASKNALLSCGKEKSVLSESRTRDSFGPINALIESCTKYSETSFPLDVGDDIGMNLLASVAAGEISKSESTATSGSPRASAAVEEPLSCNNEARSRLSYDIDVVQGHVQSDELADADSARQGKDVRPVFFKNEIILDGTNCTVYNKTTMIFQDEKASHDQIDQLSVSSESEGKQEKIKEGTLPISKSWKGEEIAGATSERDAKLIMTKYAFGSSVDCKPTTPVDDEKKAILYPREKVKDENGCTSEFPYNKVNDVHEAAGAADVKSEKLLAEESASSMIKEVLEGLCSSDQRSPALVSEKNDTGSTDAGESKTCKYANLEFGQTEDNTDEKQQLTSSSTSALDELVSTAFSSIRASLAIDHMQENKVFETCQIGLGSQEPCPGSTVQIGNHSKSIDWKASLDLEEFPSSTEATMSIPAVTDASAKLDFDLNEGILADDVYQAEPVTSPPTTKATVFLRTNVNPASNSLPVPITVAAPAKGYFVPPENLLKSKSEHGWKGSAATSAFRPAEPRKDTVCNECDNPVGGAVKMTRVPLDIDLNIADDNFLGESQNDADTTESGSRAFANCEGTTKVFSGLDLDLNRVGGSENGQCLRNTNDRAGVPLFPLKSTSTGFPNGEANVLRDFDLNSGPSFEKVCTELAPQNQDSKSSSASFLPAVADVRMNTPDFSGVPTMFPSGSSYPAVAIPSFFLDRGEQPFPIVAAPGDPRILGSVTGSGAFRGDIYRGPVHSSPSMTLPPATAFPYAAYPFGSNFPLASTMSSISTSYANSSSGSVSGFAAISSQLVGAAGAIPSHYSRPFVINIPEGSSNGGSDNYRKWGRQNLDLNAGPGNVDIGGKDGRPSLTSRQLLVSMPHTFSEEHAKYFGTSGVSMKNKEPEGSWDAERSSYKQLAWQ